MVKDGGGLGQGEKQRRSRWEGQMGDDDEWSARAQALVCTDKHLSLCAFRHISYLEGSGSKTDGVLSTDI